MTRVAEQLEAWAEAIREEAKEKSRLGAAMFDLAAVGVEESARIVRDAVPPEDWAELRRLSHLTAIIGREQAERLNRVLDAFSTDEEGT